MKKKMLFVGPLTVLLTMLFRYILRKCFVILSHFSCYIGFFISNKEWKNTLIELENQEETEMKNYWVPVLILCFSLCLSFWCIINVILTPILSIIWLLIDLIYLLCLFVMIIATVVTFLYYIRKRKENIVKKRCFILSKISLVLVLGNILLLILYAITTFALSQIFYH